MDTLYHNGRIITMEGDFPDCMVEAVVVRDGKIAFTGSLEQACKSTKGSVKMVDLDGRCLMPGFIDGHSHVTMNGQMAACADLHDCESFDDIVDALEGYLEKDFKKRTGVLLAFGYDHNFLEEKRHPDKRVLDRVSTEIPIMVLHVSGHICCVNSVMLDLAGLDSDIEDPDGGTYGRLEDGRELSGYAEEGAMAAFQKVLKEHMRPDVLKMLRSMQKAYLEHGVTTIQDGATTKSDFAMLHLASMLHLLKADVVAYPIMNDDGFRIMGKYGKKYHDYRNHLRIGGYKMILDGSPQGRTAWMTMPYEGADDGYCAYPWLDDEVVGKNAERAIDEGRQLLAHCNGDAAADQYLNAYERALEKTGSTADLRPVMVHCQTARSDQFDRMCSIGMLPSIFVGHVWYWGDVHLKNFGPERGNRVSPVGNALERGMIFNFHQDTPVTKPDAMHSVWCAVNRETRGGKRLDPAQAIDVYNALKAVTINAAYQYFEEGSKGSITPGKRADLVVLSASPLDVDPYDIRNIEVFETIKDGKTVYSKN